MKSELDKIRVELCGDHFQRLVSDDTCQHCPSKIENEVEVRSIAEGLKRSEDNGNRAIVTELASIRRSQGDMNKVLKNLVEKVQGSGSGKDGIVQRLVIVETKMNQTAKSLSVNIAIAGVVLSTILSAIGLIINLK